MALPTLRAVDPHSGTFFWRRTNRRATPFLPLHTARLTLRPGDIVRFTFTNATFTPFTVIDVTFLPPGERFALFRYQYRCYYLVLYAIVNRVTGVVVVVVVTVLLRACYAAVVRSFRRQTYRWHSTYPVLFEHCDYDDLLIFIPYTSVYFNRCDFQLRDCCCLFAITYLCSTDRDMTDIRLPLTLFAATFSPCRYQPRLLTCTCSVL